MKISKSNSGFSLVEVIVAMVLLSLLFISMTMAFKSIVSLNVLSQKKEDSSNLASTIIEQLESTEFNSIDKDENFKFTLPSTYNSDEVVYVRNKDSDDRISKIVMTGVSNGLNSYKVDVDFKVLERDASNSYSFPKLDDLGKEGTCVISTEGEIGKYNIGVNGNYTYFEGGYKISDEYKNYDYEAINSFLDSHKSHCDDLYNRDLNDLRSFNEANPESAVELPSREDYFSNIEINDLIYAKAQYGISDLIKRELVVDIVNNGDYQTVSSSLVYTFNLDKGLSLLNKLKSRGVVSQLVDNNFLGDYTNVYKVELAYNKVFTDLQNLVIVHSDFSCDYDSVTINNKTNNLIDGDKEFNLLFYSCDRGYKQGDMLVPSNTTNIRKIKVNQDLADKVISCYSNNDYIAGLLNGTGKVKAYLSVTPDNDSYIRRYKATVTVRSADGRSIYQSISCKL